VLLRRRPALVRGVSAQGHGSGRPASHLVEVEYLDGWDYPRFETVLWELEHQVGARVLNRLRLPDLGDPSMREPDRPARFDAFLDAVRWSHAAHHAVLKPAEQQNLLSPWHSAVEQEDYQLYPVWKSLLMPRVSLLLADDVGLGKTIEAGLILTELIQRRSLRRILVICPASLQRQWQEELESKFNLRFTILDSKECARITREHGTEVNPWSVTPRAITSMSYLSQEDVKERFRSDADNRMKARGAGLPWDVLVVDEAHNLAPSWVGTESRRTRMLREFQPFFDHRLFLTATPHNGYTWSFTGLLELLDPVRFHQAPTLEPSQRQHRDAVMVRRLKRDLNTPHRQRFARRDVHEVPVRLTAEEQALFEALRSYRSAAQDQAERSKHGELNRARSQVRFLFSMLGKRLLSSSYAFARTWWQHVEGLTLPPVSLKEAELAREEAEAGVESDEEQEARTGDAMRQGSAWLKSEVTGLDTDQARITAALEAVGWTSERVRSAELPSRGDWLPADGRFAALETWLEAHIREGKTWRDEERLLLFTEYKDTLAYLLWRFRRLGLQDPEILHLYGGQDLDHRESLKAAFQDQNDPVRILVATDAASEGVNLQDTCRYVFHFDIPWNPMRLEQRNGRVDRHGQARDVACFHFTSEDETDLAFLGRIARKMHDAREDLGSVGETLAHAVEERLAYGADSSADLDRRLETARAEDESRADLADSDHGSEKAYEEQLLRLRETEARLRLTPGAMERLFAEALALEGGTLDGPNADSCFHLRKIPPSWKTLVEQHLLVKKGRLKDAQAKLTFDSKVFVQKRYGRSVYRSRADVVLMRLGHPLMQRAISVLRKAMWETPSGEHPVRRWTVRKADLPSGATAHAVVYLLLDTVNALRESIEAEVVEAHFQLREDTWRLLEGVPIPAGTELPAAILEAALEPVRLVWPDLMELLSNHVNDEREQHEQDLSLQLAKRLKEESEHEGKRFDERWKELKANAARALGKTEAKELARLKNNCSQELFEERKRAMEREIREREEQQKRNLGPLRSILESERDRTLNKILPQRFQLERTNLTPIAVDLYLPN